MKFGSSVTTESWIDVFESQDESSKERRLVLIAVLQLNLGSMSLNHKMTLQRKGDSFW